MSTDSRPDLSKVTAVVFEHRYPDRAISLLHHMAKLVRFGDIKYLNHFDGWQQFNYWENFEAWKYVKTEYALFMHLDGYIINPHLWSEEFLAHDYIGAPWHHAHNPDRVGNGGFCIKSRKLMLRVSQLPWQNLPGDVTLCSFYRRQLIAEGFTFAPVPLAARFSIETRLPEHTQPTFGFHACLEGRKAWV